MSTLLASLRSKGPGLARQLVQRTTLSQRAKSLLQVREAHSAAGSGAGSLSKRIPIKQATPHSEIAKPEVYDHSSDATLAAFLLRESRLVAQRAIQAQKLRQKIPPEWVRVAAKPSPFSRRAEGLHEIVPTSKRNALDGNPVLAELQSGARTSPSLTVPRGKDGEVGGHTQTFIKLGSRGSTHTKGQAYMHRLLEEHVEALKTKGLSPSGTAASLISHQLNLLANGFDIIKSRHLTNALPNLLHVHGPLEALTAPQKTNRLRLASIIDRRRERLKERLHAYVQQTVPAHEAPKLSPLRRPLQADGSGGEVLAAPYPLNKIPDFIGEHRLAKASAWITQPLRLPKGPNKR